jgi:hypothetical protein
MSHDNTSGSHSDSDDTTQSGRGYGWQGQSRHGEHFGGRRPDFLWALKSPGINPPKVIATLAGFAIFPPLGVAALAYFWWNSRQNAGGPYAFAGGPGHQGPRRHFGCGRGRGRTGNEAFDEHQAGVLNTLYAERQAFADHRAAQRRKRDQEAYDAFRAAQAKPQDGKPDQA